MSLKKSVVDQLALECGLEPSANLDEYTIVLLAKIQRIVALGVVQQNCKRQVLQEIQDLFFDKA
jgi:hypothetical protein